MLFKINHKSFKKLTRKRNNDLHTHITYINTLKQQRNNNMPVILNSDKFEGTSVLTLLFS